MSGRRDRLERVARLVAHRLEARPDADILGVPVVRPVVTEATVLGAAFVAGLAAEELTKGWAKRVVVD